MKRTMGLLAVALGLPVLAMTGYARGAMLAPEMEIDQQVSHDSAPPPATLVERVRNATAIFRDPQQAIDVGKYEPFGGCVSGPEVGAMGVHFVNQELLRDKALDPDRPEALIYEFKNGRARLVGVEFIIPAADWDPINPEPPVPPVLEGQLFHFVDSPNRFRLPAFYELHVWSGRDNPNGSFVDWNPRVSCDGQ